VNGVPDNPYGLGQLKPRDVVTIDAAGGGGYGDPLERDVERVEADVRERYVSLDAAEKDYGVIINPKTGHADQEATEKRRETMRG
jgi:N-methylhydantoinase B